MWNVCKCNENTTNNDKRTDNCTFTGHGTSKRSTMTECNKSYEETKLPYLELQLQPHDYLVLLLNICMYYQAGDQSRNYDIL